MKKSFFNDREQFGGSKSQKRTLFGQDSSQETNQDLKDPNFDNVKQTYDKYSGMSQNQMMSELMQEVSKSKQNGTFDHAKLMENIDALAPIINKDQIEMMKSLLGKIK